MEYTNLGRSGLSVSRLCLGTMNFGPETSEADSHAIMDRAHEHGLNFFDTANVYGWKKGEGVTENIIGNWFAKGGTRRERTVVATKLYGSMGDWPNETKLSALNIRRAADASLKRLQTDYIDLYQMHHVDRETPWDEIWEAFSVLRQQGKVIYFGSSNFMRLAHRPGRRGRAHPRVPRPGVRAVDLQPDDALGRAGGPACRSSLRARRDPLVAVARRVAGRCVAQAA